MRRSLSHCCPLATLLGTLIVAILPVVAIAQSSPPPPPGPQVGVPPPPASPLTAGTIQDLQARVAKLREKVDAANKTIVDRRSEIKNKQLAIANAGRETDELIAKFKAMSDEFKAGGDYAGALKKAQDDIASQIAKFSGGSDTQRQVASKLRDIQSNFSGLDRRRDLLEQEALGAIRRLEAGKGDIEALMVLGNYQDIEKALTDMLDGFEGAVKEAREYNDAVGSTVPSQ
jgi:chromosome segregation ATPase